MADSLLSMLDSAANYTTDANSLLARLALADTICHASRPDSAADGRAGTSAGSANLAEGSAARVRARMRVELHRMGFSSCIRVTSRTIQQDTRLIQHWATELLAWRDGDTTGLIYVPVHYRVTNRRGGGPPIPTTWIQPVATVLATLCAFVADSACPEGGATEDDGPRKQVVLSFTNLAEWDGFREAQRPLPPDEPYREHTTVVTSAAGPRPPRLERSDLGWVIAQLDEDAAWPPIPATDAGLPASLADTSGVPLGPACGNGEECEMMLPGSPALHVHAVFSQGEEIVGPEELGTIGEGTLTSMRAANTIPYQTALPNVQISEGNPWWWLLPGIPFAVVAVSACLALLGAIDTAIRLCRRDVRRAQRKRWWAKVHRRALQFRLRRRCPMSHRSEADRRRDVLIEVGANNDMAAQAVEALASRPADSARVDEKSLDLGSAEDAVRRWLRDCTAWTVSRAEFLRDATDHVESLREEHLPFAQPKISPIPLKACKECTRATNESAAMTGVACSTTVKRQHELLLDEVDFGSRELKKDTDRNQALEGTLQARARNLKRRAKALATRASRLIKQMKKSAADLRNHGNRGSDTESPLSPRQLDRVIEKKRNTSRSLRKAAKAVTRDGKKLAARAKKDLNMERRHRECRVDERKASVDAHGFCALTKGLRGRRRKTEEHIAKTFGNFTRVLVKFGTFSWWHRYALKATGLTISMVLLVILLQWLPSVASLQLLSFPIGLIVPWTAMVVWLMSREGHAALRSSRRRLRLKRGGRTVVADSRSADMTESEVAFLGVAVTTAVLHAFVLRIDHCRWNVVAFGVHEDLWALAHLGVGALVFLAAGLRERRFAICSQVKASLHRLSRKKPKSIRTSVKNRSVWTMGAHALLMVSVGLVALAIDWGLTPWLSDLSALRFPMDKCRELSMGWSQIRSEWAFWWSFALVFITYLSPVLSIWRHLPDSTMKDGRQSSEAL